MSLLQRCCFTLRKQYGTFVANSLCNLENYVRWKLGYVRRCTVAQCHDQQAEYDGQSSEAEPNDKRSQHPRPAKAVSHRRISVPSLLKWRRQFNAARLRANATVPIKPTFTKTSSDMDNCRNGHYLSDQMQLAQDTENHQKWDARGQPAAA